MMRKLISFLLIMGISFNCFGYTYNQTKELIKTNKHLLEIQEDAMERFSDDPEIEWMFGLTNDGHYIVYPMRRDIYEAYQTLLAGVAILRIAKNKQEGVDLNGTATKE